jgi:D-alanine-D-alanine ligase
VRIAVLGGGRSSEHEVSLASAAAVRAGLAGGGHDVVDVALGRDGSWACGGEPVALTPGDGLLGADVVFPVLHGPFGEDGTVQGLLELLDVPYVGAGVLASALCMDKVVFKEVMAAAGVPQVAYAGVHRARWRAEPKAVLLELATLGEPVWVKPARLGSSVGIAPASDPAALAAALDDAFAHDELVIAEASALGLEVECSVMGHDEPEVSVPGEIVLPHGGWYDYEAKYTPGGMTLQVPARISETATARVRQLAAEAFLGARCSGLARADFFVDGEDVLLNELNTLPGFTETSVYAALWAASGVPFGELLDRLIGFALARATSA